MSQTYSYTIFGLKIKSEIECPELLPLNGVAEEDVVIRFDKVPAKLKKPSYQGAIYQTAPSEFLLDLKPIARYYAVAGNMITIDKYANATNNDIRVFLLGTIFGALLHQRQMLPLHGSAIEIEPGKAAIFAGYSGAGKSTLAAKFSKNGYKVLADDIAVIKLGHDERLWVYPSFPQIKLWEDSLVQIGESIEDKTRIRNKINKYGMKILSTFSSHHAELKKLYFIKHHKEEKLEIIPLKGSEKIYELLNNTFRKNFVKGLGTEKEHFILMNKVAEKVDLKLVMRPFSSFQLNDLFKFIEQDLKS